MIKDILKKHRIGEDDKDAPIARYFREAVELDLLRYFEEQINNITKPTADKYIFDINKLSEDILSWKNSREPIGWDYAIQFVADLLVRINTTTYYKPKELHHGEYLENKKYIVFDAEKLKNYLKYSKATGGSLAVTGWNNAIDHIFKYIFPKEMIGGMEKE